MRRITFVGATAILPDRLLENATVVCDKGRIQRIATDLDPDPNAEIVDLKGQFIAPGYVDIHVHGGAGADFMDGTPEAVRCACTSHLRHGTTTIFPTTTTGSENQILAMLNACRQVMADDSGPHVAGVHLYGPFFAEDKVGCHSLLGRRTPTVTEFEAYFASGLIRIATCAAELTGADAFYRAAAKRNCLITCGHSNASWSEMKKAFDLGMRHVDHFWCAMSSVPSLRKRFSVPMQASMAEFVLMNREMSTEVIADGQHLAAELLEFAYQMIGPERLCLVTDCNRALGMPPGDYRFGNNLDGSWLKSDGLVGWAPDGGSLASSIVGMDHMVRKMKDSTTATLPEVVRMASLTPATRAGVENEAGSIDVGKRADLLILNRELFVQHVYVSGHRIPGG